MQCEITDRRYENDKVQRPPSIEDYPEGFNGKQLCRNDGYPEAKHRLGLPGQRYLGSCENRQWQNTGFPYSGTKRFASVRSSGLQYMTNKSIVSGIGNFVLQTMDETGWSRCINYYTNERAGVSDIRDVAESGSVSRYFGRLGYRREGFKIREETYGPVQYSYMYTRTFAPAYGRKSVIRLCKYAGNCQIIFFALD